MLFQIEVRIVERAAEKWDHVMAAGAPARGFDIAISFEGDFARLTHAEQVRLVVEGTEVVRAMEPAFVGVLMALQTIVIHHQRARGNEIAGGGSRKGGM